jgi:4-diphosphocytidyl-2-C-methyl-D-erythritol kinase
MPDTLVLRSYAKINLTLDVFSKRADGYHSLASVMQAISLHDTLTLQTSQTPGITFTCDAPDTIPIPLDATNLVVRAANAVLTAVPLMAPGVVVHLVKRIPAQAGLGGGSSNAAATLAGVNALMGFPLDAKALRSCAAFLGSDVPFFLMGGAATARGRGENLTALPDAPALWLVIVKPDVGVSTAWAYNELDSLPDRVSHRGTKRMEECIRAGERDRMVALQCNDFELPVFRQIPKLSWLHDELRMAGAETAHLCGSGSALYGVAANEAEAQRIARLFEGRYPHVHIARTLSRPESQLLAPLAEAARHV